MQAVVLDLFGTLVAAPTLEERASASSQVAAVVGCDATTVESYFRDTWHVRHNGALPTLADLAAHLVSVVHGPGAAVGPVADKLRTLGRTRLVPAPSVIHTLKSLRGQQLRLGILSDASAEIVAAWPSSSLAALVDVAMFSCAAGALKPDQRLYGRICAELEVPPDQVEQVVVPTENVHLLLNGADPLHAALADPAAVAIHGLRCNVIGSPGGLAIVGASTVGLLTALYAHQKGWKVTIVHRDGHPPADAVATAVPAAFRSPATLSPHHFFDVVVDAATGVDPGPLELALRLVGDGGTVIVQNAYHPGVRLPTPLRDLFRRSIRLIGSFSYCRRGPDDFTLALDLLRSHAARVAHLVASVSDLADLPAVLGGQRMRSIRQVLTVHSS